MSVFLGIIVSVLLVILVVLAIIFFSVKTKKNRGNGITAMATTTTPGPKISWWPLPIGTQIALVWIIIGIIAILINQDNFKEFVWDKTATRLIFMAIILLSLSYILNLGRKPSTGPPLFIRDILIISFVIYIIACSFFKWDGNFGSLKFWGNQHQSKTSEQSQRDNFPGVEIVSSDKPSEAVNLCPQWTEVPSSGRILLVDFPSNREWRFLINTTGPVKFKTSGGWETVDGSDIRVSKGGKIFAYGNGYNIARVKAKIL